MTPPRRRPRGAPASGSRCCRSPPRRSPTPRSGGSPESMPSTHMCPAWTDRSQRSSVSIALKAIAPSWSRTLIFGKSGLPVRSTSNSISTPIGRRTSTRPAASPRAGAPGSPGSARGRSPAPTRGPRALGPGRVRLVEVVGDDLRGRPVADELPAVDPDRAVAELRDGRQRMRHEERRSCPYCRAPPSARGSGAGTRRRRPRAPRRRAGSPARDGRRPRRRAARTCRWSSA